MKLFKTEKVKKFFDILQKMDRAYSVDVDKQIYKGYDKNNPHIVWCQKQVFVNRTINKWLSKKYLKFYKEDEVTSIEYIQYFNIVKIKYKLGYGEDLIVHIIDYTRPYSIFNKIVLSYNDVICAEGEWTDNKQHLELLNLIKLDIPEKEFIFNAFNLSLYPKRRSKNWTEDKIKVKFSVLAKTEKEALKKANKYCEENKLFLIN